MAKSDLNGNDWFWILVVVGAFGWGAYDKWFKDDTPPIATYAPPPPSAEMAAPPPTPDPTLELPRWLFVTGTDSGTRWLLDTQSIKGGKDARVSWVKEDHSADRSVPFRKTMVLYSMNCTTTGYQVLSILKYDKSGKVQQSADYQEPQTVYAPPESRIASVMGEACKDRHDPPKP